MSRRERPSIFEARQITHAPLEITDHKKMKAVLHLGDQKTGSKSLQAMLCSNTSAWGPFGVTTPEVTKLGLYDAGLVAMAAYDPGSGETLADSLPSQHAIWVDRFRRRRGLASYSEVDQLIRVNLANQLQNMETALFSFENLFWLESRSIATLRTRLAEFFDEFQIVVFLRRQDRKAVSLYSSKLLSAREELPLLPKERGSFDYYAALTRWQENFSPDAIAVHIYEDEPDSTRAFAKHHLPRDLPVVFPERHNEALGGRAQEVLSALHIHFGDMLPPESEAHALRLAITNAVKGGHRAMPSEAAARAFMNAFDEGNRQLCRDFRPDRETLFDADFSEYISSPPQEHVFTAEEMANLALTVWSTRGRVERARLRSVVVDSRS